MRIDGQLISKYFSRDGNWREQRKHLKITLKRSARWIEKVICGVPAITKILLQDSSMLGMAKENQYMTVSTSALKQS